MADDYKDGADNQRNKGSKDERNEEDLVNDCEHERSIDYMGENEVNAGGGDKESTEVKEISYSEPLTEHWDGSGSEANEKINELEETTEAAEEEKPEDVKMDSHEEEKPKFVERGSPEEEKPRSIERDLPEEEKPKPVQRESLEEEKPKYVERVFSEVEKPKLVKSGFREEGKPKPIKRGLLDEPVVREGKRQRYTVERLAAISSPPPRKASLDAVGSGTSLGDIEFVNISISKAQNETLKWLHRLCYGTPGTAASRKRDLRRFNGFAFDEKSIDFEKKKATAMKLTNNELHMIGRVLGSERGHTKEETVKNVLHFLQKPEDKGKKIISGKKRRSSSKSEKKTKRSKSEKKGNKKSMKKSNEESSENCDAGHSGVESSHDGDSDEKKSGSINTLKNHPEKMKGSGELTSISKSAAKQEDSTWGDGGPSNVEVETTINEILRTVDLVNCTMKEMCERIAEKFPNLDMTTYKSALKERVKAALEKMEDS